jgi:predicted component of viral defense system (DUF524 family)
MSSLTQCLINCLSSSGRKLATLRITPASDASTIRRDPSTQTPQLHENGRYWCELVACDVNSAHLQCSLFRARAPGQGETWLLETGANAGLLRIDLVDKDNHVIGAAWTEVHSLKLDEREHYRAMLNDISERMLGLLHDLRSSSTTTLVTAWRSEPGALQQQLAFLCEAVEAPAFHHAIQRILNAPHRDMQSEPATQSINRPIKQNAAFVRQMSSVSQRMPVPANHTLAAHVRSVPARITATRDIDDFDTPPNQFVKFALEHTRNFLSHAASVLRAGGVEWQMPAMRATRCERVIAQWLSHSLFANLSSLRKVPMNSAVLQRKAGYREVLRLWLRFGAGAQLAWDAADELFHAGKRDTAQLYEYWLFFQLLDWFCMRFDVAQPPAQSLVEHSANGWTLRLKHGEASPPIIGTSNGMQAQFQYNRTFAAPCESWTQSMRPDFTISFWPASMTQDEAAAQGRLMHLHFDAKYRVDKPSDMLGERGPTREDLLKMHAYRDAIHHTAGAYVLFPGRGEPALLRRDDESMPSLGAFGVMPAHSAQGIAQVDALIDDALEAGYNHAHAHQLRH